MLWSFLDWSHAIVFITGCYFKAYLNEVYSGFIFCTYLSSFGQEMEVTDEGGNENTEIS